MREKNIIIFRTEESRDNEVNKRKQHYISFFNELCKNGLKMDTLKVEDITRLGKQEHERSRPIRIKLQNKGDKTKMMEATRNLRNTEDRFRRISITDDITKTEREEVSGLVKQSKTGWRGMGQTHGYTG